MDKNQVVLNSTLVSILMLTYNRAHFISEAILSVLAQTYQNWELFIIDDGSTDTTSEIVGRFSDPRIHYIQHKENAGLLKRRQESLTYVTSTYVAVLDSDDVWLEPEKLEKQVAYLETNEKAVLVGTALIRLDEHGRKIGETRYETSDARIRAKLLIRNQFAHSSVLMRASAVTKTAGYRFPLAEDLDLFLQLGQLGTLANLPEPMTGYRVHNESETNRRSALLTNILTIICAYKNTYPGYYLSYAKYSLYRLLIKFCKFS